jgi:hypothetical protein
LEHLVGWRRGGHRESFSFGLGGKKKKKSAPKLFFFFGEGMSVGEVDV